MDHRVEPDLWLTDGSDEGAPGGSQPTEAAPAGQAPAGDAGARADLPLPGKAASGSSSNGTVGRDVPYPGQDVPYTGQQAAVDSATGPGVQEKPPSSATAGYSYRPAAEQAQGEGLRVPPYQPQVPPPAPYPAQVPPGPSPGMASRVTAPFASLTRPKVRKPSRPSRPSAAAAAAAMPPTAAAVRERVAAATRTGNVPRGNAPTRRAQLVLARIEPWSVMKFSFMVSLVGWVILFVAVAALYYVLSKLGVFHAIQSTITSVTSSKGTAGADANGSWFSASRILGYTMLVGAVNVVLITALATVGAVIYNLVTHLAGGIEVTLKETD